MLHLVAQHHGMPTSPASEGWFDGVLPSASNSSSGWSGAASCGTQSIFDGYSAWLWVITMVVAQ